MLVYIFFRVFIYFFSCVGFYIVVIRSVFLCLWIEFVGVELVVFVEGVWGEVLVFFLLL